MMAITQNITFTISLNFSSVKSIFSIYQICLAYFKSPFGGLLSITPSAFSCGKELLLTDS
jgi:hypothetical protein